MENLTFVKGSRDLDGLDPVSAAILEVGSTGTSIFDPVLCEIAYRWFCPPGRAVLDPFAGGSVRGIVASRLGRAYTGIDLRAEQVDANRAQAEQICGDPMPKWVCGDSREVMPALAQNGMAPQFDFVFSCPPYADLEVYSDDRRDLSTLEYDDFRAAYASIIAGACALLKPDRFACFVVGDVRDRQGFYRNFPGHTIEAFEAAGLRLYNEAILVTAVGSLPIRAGKQFAASRKLGKTHQQVYVFCKGDPRKATEAVGEVEFAEIEASESADASLSGVSEL
jgi:DNA modification methylase